jgi:hypothetical protein
MPRDGAIIFSDLIGKLAVPFIHWNKALNQQFQFTVDDGSG